MYKTNLIKLIKETYALTGEMKEDILSRVDKYSPELIAKVTRIIKNKEEEAKLLYDKKQINDIWNNYNELREMISQMEKEDLEWDIEELLSKLD